MDIWLLVRKEAAGRNPDEKPDVSREARLLIREALAARAQGKRPTYLEQLSAGGSKDRHTINLTSQVWNEVYDSALEVAPNEDPCVATHARRLLLEAMSARRAAGS